MRGPEIRLGIRTGEHVSFVGLHGDHPDFPHSRPSACVRTTPAAPNSGARSHPASAILARLTSSSVAIGTTMPGRLRDVHLPQSENALNCSCPRDLAQW